MLKVIILKKNGILNNGELTKSYSNISCFIKK